MAVGRRVKIRIDTNEKTKINKFYSKHKLSLVAHFNKTFYLEKVLPGTSRFFCHHTLIQFSSSNYKSNINVNYMFRFGSTTTRRFISFKRKDNKYISLCMDLTLVPFPTTVLNV